METKKSIWTDPKRNWIGFIAIIMIILGLNSSFFILREGEQASAFAFGEARRDYTTPGLKLKAPWPFETIKKVDKRLLLYSGREMVLKEKSKKNLLIDWFCLYRIDNPKTYFTKVVSMGKAERRIDDNISSDISAILGENLFDDIDLSVKFLSFNRVELPDENKNSVFNDMIADRNKISQGYIAEGKKNQDSIQAVADFKVAEILSAAQREAGMIKGSADSIRLAILNSSYRKSQELFKLYNEIETFKKVYKDNTEWVLSPEGLIPRK